MTRDKGSINYSHYKYAVTFKGKTQYFAAQPRIKERYNLSTNAVTRCLRHSDEIDDRCYLKDYKIITISPLPIYKITREYKSDDEYHIIYKKIVYTTLNP
tara:strand:+ start:604 stop:903 length:300 start_codon:yes stop_codon:yes gene_type:complete